MTSILLVEDDSVLREMYEDKFKHEGFDVHVAVDGEEALSMLAEIKPEAMVLDLIMPKLTGFDVVKQMYANPEWKKIPVLVLTNVMADGEDLVKNWGVKSFMLKSNVNPDDVVKKIKTILNPPARVD